MQELTESGRGLVESLLSAPVAWQTPAELSRATGLGDEELSDLLATLDVGGWLAAWEREAGVVVTLSVAAASSLGVRLVEVGPEEVPRWARAGDREPPRPKAAGVFRGERAAMLGLVVDRAPGAELAAERAEEADSLPDHPGGARKGPSAEDLPKPTHYLGGRLSPWPGPGDGRKGSCPSCHSGPLTPSSYCLYCDRWGLDHLLLELSPLPKVSRRDRRDDVRRKDCERLTRKEKRRARRKHQADAERLLRAKARPRPSPSPRDRAPGAAPVDRENPDVRAYPSVALSSSPIP